jgi:hypothetical protein
VHSLPTTNIKLYACEPLALGELEFVTSLRKKPALLTIFARDSFIYPFRLSHGGFIYHILRLKKREKEKRETKQIKYSYWRSAKRKGPEKMRPPKNPAQRETRGSIRPKIKCKSVHLPLWTPQKSSPPSPDLTYLAHFTWLDQSASPFFCFGLLYRIMDLF